MALGRCLSVCFKVVVRAYFDKVAQLRLDVVRNRLQKSLEFLSLGFGFSVSSMYRTIL